MYDKKFWDNIKVNSTKPKLNQAKSTSVKVTTITEEELTRVSVLKAYLDRKKNKVDITTWERSAIEDIIGFVNRIWGMRR